LEEYPLESLNHGEPVIDTETGMFDPKACKNEDCIGRATELLITQADFRSAEDGFGGHTIEWSRKSPQNQLILDEYKRMIQHQQMTLGKKFIEYQDKQPNRDSYDNAKPNNRGSSPNTAYCSIPRSVGGRVARDQNDTSHAPISRMKQIASIQCSPGTVIINHMKHLKVSGNTIDSFSAG
jgi:hypothetical protein